LPFAKAERGDRKCNGWIKPPQSKERVRGEADQHRTGKDRAEDILRPFAVGGARSELFANPLFRNPKTRTEHERAGGERDADP
jgi:hypothetical protein